MSDFKAKMHQIRSQPLTPLEELTARSPDRLTVLCGVTVRRNQNKHHFIIIIIIIIIGIF